MKLYSIACVMVVFAFGSSNSQQNIELPWKATNQVGSSKPITETQLGELRDGKPVLTYSSVSTMRQELGIFYKASEMAVTDISIEAGDYYLIGEGQSNGGGKLIFALLLEENSGMLNLTTECVTHVCITRACCNKCSKTIFSRDSGKCDCEVEETADNCYNKQSKMSCSYTNASYDGGPEITALVTNLENNAN